MSHPHNTSSGDLWNDEIVPQLPTDLDAQAVALGAYVRQRKCARPRDLLRGILAYAATARSLRDLGAWGVLQGVADLAPSSWWERIRAAGPWLQWIAETMLDIPRPTWVTQAVRGRVLLVDASCVGWHGGTGNEFRLHTAVDLLAGRLAQVVLTERSGREHIDHFSIHPGDIVVMDGGYGFRDRVGLLRAAQADTVVRIYPATFPLETAIGRPLDVRAWLDRVRGSHTSVVASYRYEGQRIPVRVLAYRLTEPQRQRAYRKAKTRARKRQRPLHALTTYFADWAIIVTTLMDTATWPDTAIWRLYGARWQVELVFKRMKQCLAIGSLRCRTRESGIALVWALVVIWVLHEPHRESMRRELQALATPHPRTIPGQAPKADAVVSSWGLTHLLIDTIRNSIRGIWSIHRIMACLPRLRRYLVTHPRHDREHQETEILAWLTGVRRTPRAAHCDAAY